MSQAQPDNRVRFVEIGERPYVKRAFPAQTSFFSTYAVDRGSDPASGRYTVTMGSLPTLARLVRSPDLDLIVCHPSFHAPWHWRWLNRALFDRRTLTGHLPIARAFGPQVLRGRVAAPIAVVDHEDLPVINSSNFFLLDACTVYFKRELPVDHWRLFLKTGHANLPTPRFRLLKRYAVRLSKIRPLSLGLPFAFAAPDLVAPDGKEVDVFFAGRVEGSSTVRERGYRELMALKAHGIVVDVPQSRLPPAEFYARCARAWLTWSPEGLGWDCFRHYEAPACGSVPLINHPPIERHAPLLDGRHAIYYDPEEGGLTRAITAALADKPRLAAIAEAGRKHVLQLHTPKALAAYIVETTLAARARGSTDQE
jgi:hypothetical protein